MKFVLILKQKAIPLNYHCTSDNKVSDRHSVQVNAVIGTLKLIWIDHSRTVNGRLSHILKALRLPAGFLYSATLI